MGIIQNENHIVWESWESYIMGIIHYENLTLWESTATNM
jgi:hypothetical protein